MECIDDSIAVNLWTEHDADRFEQVKEATARVLFGLVVNNGTADSSDDDDDDDNKNVGATTLLNPTEESLRFDENLELLSSTLAKLHTTSASDAHDSAGTERRLSLEQLTNVLLCDDVLALVASKLAAIH